MAETLYCSFCGKSQHEVKLLIAGPNVFICGVCVDFCNAIVAEARSPVKKQHETLLAMLDKPLP